MEGKEVRFGIGSSSLFATVTTAASCGAVNSMHDSYTGTGGLVPMLQMMLGEVVLAVSAPDLRYDAVRIYHSFHCWPDGRTYT